MKTTAFLIGSLSLLLSANPVMAESTPFIEAGQWLSGGSSMASSEPGDGVRRSFAMALLDPLEGHQPAVQTAASFGPRSVLLGYEIYYKNPHGNTN